MKTCINLGDAFPMYRLRMGADHQPGDRRDPWNFEIPCGRLKAFVYPHGGMRLQAWITTARVTKALALLAAAGARPHQVGDGEATVLFDVAEAPAVFLVLRPKLKRPSSTAGIAALARYRQAQRRQGDIGTPNSSSDAPGPSPPLLAARRDQEGVSASASALTRPADGGRK